MIEKPKKTIIYIRNQEGETKTIYETLYRLVKLVTQDKRLKLIGVLIDSDPYVWQRPFLLSMYEAKKLDCIVCEELSELCFNNKTYMEIMLLLDKGLDVLAVDGNGFLMSVK